jgi:aminoglycoside phosphotransferase (APT) family kinase protein
MARMHEWLLAHRPPDSAPRVVHGDFRIGNAIHAPDGSIAAVLDWELCTLGDPLSDVSYLLATGASRRLAPSRPRRPRPGSHRRPS